MTENQYLMGVDLGLSGVKTGIFGMSGRCVGLSHGGYPMERPYPDWAEQDQNLWWSEVTRTIKEALYQSKIVSDKIVGIGVTGFGHGISPLTRDGKILTKCNTSQDQRSTKQVEWLRRNLNIDGRYFGGTPLISSKILWLKENRPEIFNKTYKFLFPNSFIVFKLTGEFSADIDNAWNPDTFDFQKGDWSDALLQKIGIPYEKLPKVYKSWEIVGKVTRKAADETGLKKGTPVIAGAMDAACCRYGAGCIKPGRSIDITGTVGMWGVAVDSKAPVGHTTFTLIPSVGFVRGGGSRTAGGP